MKIENHPISEGFIPEGTRVLVIGTFPPEKEYKKKKDGFFFYSSELNQFWNRIDNIFPDAKLKKTAQRNSTETFEENKERKEDFATQKGIGFIDIYSKISRKAETANDSDLVPIETIFHNGTFTKIMDTNHVKRICCTYKLAYECFKCNLGLFAKDISVIENNSTGSGEIICFKWNGSYIELILLFPATRSRHKGDLKDEQYKKFLFQ